MKGMRYRCWVYPKIHESTLGWMPITLLHIGRLKIRLYPQARNIGIIVNPEHIEYTGSVQDFLAEEFFCSITFFVIIAITFTWKLKKRFGVAYPRL